MKINLWYSKGVSEWRWTLCEEFRNGVTKMEQYSGTQKELRDAMNDVANTVEYMLDERQTAGWGISSKERTSKKDAKNKHI